MKTLLFPIISSSVLLLLFVRLLAETWQEVWTTLGYTALIAVVCFIVAAMWGEALSKIR